MSSSVYRCIGNGHGLECFNCGKDRAIATSIAHVKTMQEGRALKLTVSAYAQESREQDPPIMRIQSERIGKLGISCRTQNGNTCCTPTRSGASQVDVRSLPSRWPGCEVAMIIVKEIACVLASPDTGSRVPIDLLFKYLLEWIQWIPFSRKLYRSGGAQYLVREKRNWMSRGLCGPLTVDTTESYETGSAPVNGIKLRRLGRIE
nr:hypothetical protein Iba_chr13bCG8930 [Ipomoea batatas]